MAWGVDLRLRFKRWRQEIHLHHRAEWCWQVQLLDDFLDTSFSPRCAVCVISLFLFIMLAIFDGICGYLISGPT